MTSRRCLAGDFALGRVALVSTYFGQYASDMPAAGARHWRRQKMISAVAITVLLVTIAIVLIVANEGHASVGSFNACLSDKPFLTTTVTKSNGRVIDRIRDRASGSVVGELAMLPTVRARESFNTTNWPGGSGSANGRFLLLTRSPFGRAAQAMFTCSQSVIPGP